VTASTERSALKDAVEDFLFEEASILDDWRLDEWEALFTEDARYLIPSTDVPDSESGQALALVDDNIVEIRGRVSRLKSRHAHREFPWSRTRRLITNVRIADVRADEVDVTANFLIMRVRNLHVAQFQAATPTRSSTPVPVVARTSSRSAPGEPSSTWRYWAPTEASASSFDSPVRACLGWAGAALGAAPGALPLRTVAGDVQGSLTERNLRPLHHGRSTDRTFRMWWVGASSV
jgi:p-cumate 2,3-dioxygenase subunit beta